MKSGYLNTAKEFSIISAGCLIVAIAVHFFMQPFQLTMGSVAGLAIIVEHLTHIPVSVVTLAVNLVLLEAQKSAASGVRVEKPLYIYDENGNYTEETLAFYHMT